MTMTTYDFYDLSGQLLDTIATDSPEDCIGEISHFAGVDADEITFEVTE